jgi:hypothetical protein
MRVSIVWGFNVYMLENMLVYFDVTLFIDIYEHEIVKFGKLSYRIIYKFIGLNTKLSFKK